MSDPDPNGPHHDLPAPRPYAIIVYGATGFTGRLICSYLNTHHEMQGLPWAVAGRSAEKLREVATELSNPGRVQVVVADSTNHAALDAMASSTDVLINAAGPYLSCGTPVVDRCIAHGTHYCDISGEVTWVRRMLQRYSGPAEAAGVTLVPMSGFDSVPADLSAMLIKQRAQISQERLLSVNAYIKAQSIKGGLSGGTLNSMRHTVVRDAKELARATFDRSYLCFPLKGTQQASSSGTGPRGIWYGRAFGWTTPWFGAVNAKVVHRTAYLSGPGAQYPVYSEALQHDGVLSALLWVALFYSCVIVLLIPPLRWLAFTLCLPAPGQGPAPSVLENGGMQITFVGQTESAPICVNFTLHRDPAYKSSAIMVSEVALLLRARSEEHRRATVGFQTPVSVGGEALVNRLRNAEEGTAFTIEYV